MRIAIFTVGSHGDINPYLAVARELIRRGHSVGFYATAYFADDARESGVDFHPLNADLNVEDLMRDPDLMHRFKGGPRVFELLYDGIPEMLASTRREISDHRPSAILAHQITFGARWAAQEASVPVAIGALSPMMWINPRDPVRFFQTRPGALARAAAIAATPVMKVAASWLFFRRFNDIRRAHGFAPLDEPMAAEFSGGDINLGLWSPHLRPAYEGDPADSHVCGFTWHDRSHAQTLDPALESFLLDGEPPIVFTLGTAAVHTAGDFYHLAIDAARRLNRRAVLLTGRAAYAPPPGDIPRGMITVPYAPYSLLLPRCAASIHHGGIGSTAQALRSGRPMVVVPHAHDQFNNAVRAHELGVASIVPRHRLNARRLADAIARITDRPEVDQNAAAIASRIAAEDGAKAAADHMERLAAGSSR